MKKAGNGMPFFLMGWIASGHRRMLDTALPQTLLYALMLSRMRLPNGKHTRPTGRAGIQIEQPSHDILETFKGAVVLVGTCLRRSRTCHVGGGLPQQQPVRSTSWRTVLENCRRRRHG